MNTRLAPLGQAAPAPASPRGVAVVGETGAREEAFLVARAIYGSSLRPAGLDELRARILAGDPAPPNTKPEIRELSETRGAIHTATSPHNAASKRLLASLGRELNVHAIVVVSAAASADANADVPNPDVKPADAKPDGAKPAGVATDANADVGTSTGSATTPVVRLFLVQEGEFDAARYSPDTGAAATGSARWQGLVRSIERRFPAPAAPPPAETNRVPVVPSVLNSNEKPESKPFYTSPWLWGALAGAALVGGFIFFATRDTSDDTIQLDMRVPR